MSTTSAVAANGDFWHLQPNRAPELIFCTGAVHPEFEHLLSASHMLYKVSAQLVEVLNAAVLVMEGAGLDESIPPILEAQRGIETAMRCATHGIKKVLSDRSKGVDSRRTSN